MKCLICGRNGVPGAKLCADCSSARKRAFAATVTQPLLLAAGSGRGAKPLLRPSQSIAATARRSAERALLAKPIVEAPQPPPARRLRLAAFAVAALAVCVVGAILVYHRSANRATDSTQLADQPASVPRAPVAEATSMVPPQLAPKSVSETTSSPSNAGATASGDPAKTEPPKRVAAKPRAPPPEPSAPPPDPPPPALAAAPVVEAPPPVREAPPVDPLQQMRDSLARCANGDLIDRILCDQRVRREYCATRWGLVPQCPSGVANDRGQ